MTLAVAAGIAVALAVGGLSRAGSEAEEAPTAGLLSVQSLVVFVLVGGFTRAARRPADPDGAATCVLAGAADDGRFRRGVARAGIAAIACPALALLLPAHAATMGVSGAAWHAAFGLALSILAIEAALARRDGLPFVEPHEKGDNQVVLGIGVALAALAASRVIGWLESAALASATGTLAAAATFVAAWVAVHVAGRRSVPRAPRLVAPPAMAVARLDLGE